MTNTMNTDTKNKNIWTTSIKSILYFNKFRRKKPQIQPFLDVYYFQKKHINSAFREKLIDRKYLNIIMLSFNCCIGREVRFHTVTG